MDFIVVIYLSVKLTLKTCRIDYLSQAFYRFIDFK